MNLTKAAIISSIMTVLLFATDLYFNFSVIAILYVCFVFFALLTNDERFIVGATIVSTVLIVAGWVYHDSTLVYDNVARLMAVVVVWGAGLLSLQRKQVEHRLQLLNETLELRVMARTAAAEEKSKRLEQQIRVLKEIRYSGTRNALSKLDTVISNLKELSRINNG